MNANHSFIYLLFTVKKFLTGIKGQYSSKVMSEELRRIYSIYFLKMPAAIFYNIFLCKVKPRHPEMKALHSFPVVGQNFREFRVTIYKQCIARCY